MTDVTASPRSAEAASESEVLPQYLILKSNPAKKLSPRFPGSITYEIGKHVDNQTLAIRIAHNDSGGLFSKEWIALTDIAELLARAESDKPIKSAAFKSLFKAGSANNAGFLCAALRAEGVLLQAPKAIFFHVPGHPVKDWLESLDALEPISEQPEASNNVDKNANSSTATDATDSSDQAQTLTSPAKGRAAKRQKTSASPKSQNDSSSTEEP